MAYQKKGRTLWKPPSFEDFNVTLPSKKIKLDTNDFCEEKSNKVEPKCVDDLVIHPKKIDEVRNWIKLSTNEKAAVLLVTGPSGSGKTTTINLVAKSEEFAIKEWINPIDKTEYQTASVLDTGVYDKFNYVESKQIDKFEDFVFKSSRYNSLFEDSKKALILIEDIPNIFIWKPNLFHEFLEKYKTFGKYPIIFTLTNNQNCKLVSDLFPNHVKSKFNISTIKFNAVNNGALVKNLKSLAEAYYSEKLTSQFLQTLSKNSGGDLRTANSDLFLLLRDGGKKLSTQLKEVKNGESGMKPVSEKDTYFDFYHTLGRILYPKTMTESEKVGCKNPNKKFTYDALKISENWSGSYLSLLHENYLSTFENLKDVVGAADCFSLCDVIAHHPELEEYTNHISVLGLMCGNTQPKKSGFNPIKKSHQLKFSLNFEGDMKYFYQKDTLLDLMPLLKIIGGDTSVLNDWKEVDSESEEDVQIEDVDN